jgi:class 3 adenylate cyclase
VLLTQTTADLVDGSGIALEDAGEHELKGISGARRLLRVAAPA